MRRLPVIFLLLLGAASYPVAASVDLKTRLLVGEVQFLAQQQKYFDALLRIDDVQLISRQQLQRALDELHREHANGDNSGPVLSQADIELGYRMSQRAGSAIRAVLREDIPQQQRNRAAFQLAKIYYDKQQYDYAQYALQLIRGELFYPFSHDVKYLQARIHARSGEFEDAIAVLQQLQYDDRFRGFAAYNLAHTLIEVGQIQDGLDKLAQVGEMDVYTEPLLSLRDKANLVLGYTALENNETDDALLYLSRVRLKSAFANKALLGIAWINMRKQDYQAAIPAWTELQGREADSAAVQEAWLGLPYSYGKLGAYGKAIELYEFAIADYENVLTDIEATLDDVRSGRFFQQVHAQRLKATNEGMLRLRELEPMAYLDELIAQPEFQTAMKNIIELGDMQSHLQQWQDTAVALESLVDMREQFAKQVAGKAGAALREVDSQLAGLALQRDTLADMLASITLDNNLRLLASEDEQTLLASLQQIRLASEAQLDKDKLLQRIRRASGVIDWRLAQQYRQRRDALTEQLNELNSLIQVQQAKRDRLLNKLQRVENVAAYKVPLFTVKKQIASLQARLQSLSDEQQTSVKTMMTQALEKRRALVKQYLATARYELAKNYDLVAAQQRESEPPTDESAAAP